MDGEWRRQPRQPDSVAFGNGTFIAVGGGVTYKDGLGGRILTSRDGKEWKEFGNGRLVVVGPDGLRMSSSDGITWKHEAHESKVKLESVVWTGREFITSGD